PQRRRNVQGQPGAAPAGARRHEIDPRQPLQPGRGHRRALAGDVRPRHRRAGVPRRGVAGPGDRQPLRQHDRPLLARPPLEGDGDERRPSGLVGPAVLSQWIEFLDFYVARKIPSIPPAARAVASLLLPRLFGKGATLAPDRFTGEPDYASALRAYES